MILHPFGLWFLASVDLTLKGVLLGKLDAEIEILNYFITLVKTTYLDE